MQRVQLGVEVPDTLRDELDEAARKQYKRRSEAVREAIVEWLVRQDEKKEV